MAWSDRPWVLEGAAVRISMVGFDDGTEKKRQLNGLEVDIINADLTTMADITQARVLPENGHFSFIGTQKGGAFDISEADARMLLERANSSGVNNSEVLCPFWGSCAIVVLIGWRDEANA